MILQRFTITEVGDDRYTITCHEDWGGDVLVTWGDGSHETNAAGINNYIHFIENVLGLNRWKCEWKRVYLPVSDVKESIETMDRLMNGKGVSLPDARKSWEIIKKALERARQ